MLGSLCTYDLLAMMLAACPNSNVRQKTSFPVYDCKKRFFSPPLSGFAKIDLLLVRECGSYLHSFSGINS